MILQTISGARVGSLWLAIERATEDEGNIDDDVKSLFSSAISAAKRGKGNFEKPEVIRSFARELLERVAHFPLGARPDDLPDTRGKWAYLYLMALVHEAFPLNRDYTNLMWDYVSPLARDLWTVREASLEEAQDEFTEIPGSISDLPTWLQRWAYGHRDFLSEHAPHEW